MKLPRSSDGPLARGPVLSAAGADAILRSIDPSSPSGLRDRALMGILNYALARVSAAIAVRLRDYRVQADSGIWVLRLVEKGCEPRDIVVHRVLRQYLDEYLRQDLHPTYGMTEGVPLFPSSLQSAKPDEVQVMSQLEAWAAIKFRGAAIGIAVDPFWLNEPGVS